MTPALSRAITKATKEFDLPGRMVAFLELQLGAKEEADGRWVLETRAGRLRILPELASVHAVFEQPSRAYKLLVDVRYPSGVWPLPIALKDATGPTEAVQILSAFWARFQARVRAVAVLPSPGTSPNLTTRVVSETNATMHPNLRTPK